MQSGTFGSVFQIDLLLTQVSETVPVAVSGTECLSHCRTNFLHDAPASEKSQAEVGGVPKTTAARGALCRSTSGLAEKVRPHVGGFPSASEQTVGLLSLGSIKNFRKFRALRGTSPPRKFPFPEYPCHAENNIQRKSGLVGCRRSGEQRVVELLHFGVDRLLQGGPGLAVGRFAGIDQVVVLARIGTQMEKFVPARI
jgi:hypothetical protein